MVMSPERITLIGLSSSTGLSLTSSVTLVLDGAGPMSLEQAESALSRLPKPVACACVNENGHLVITTSLPDPTAILFLKERPPFERISEGSISPRVLALGADLLLLRGNGVEDFVQRSIFQRWAREYVLGFPFALNVSRGTGELNGVDVIAFTQSVAISKEEFLRALRSDQMD